MKLFVWSLVVAVSLQGLGQSAWAQSTRVQDTIKQAGQSFDEQIKQKKQQINDAELALTELQSQMSAARGNNQSSGGITLKKVFLVTAVASAAALVYGLATTRLEGDVIVLPIPGRGTFIGLLGLMASGIGYMTTDASLVFLSSDEDTKLSADLDQAQLEVAALKRALVRLESQNP